MISFLKKTKMAAQERYGQITLAALKSKDWVSHLPEFEQLERDGLSEASLALGQLHSGIDDSVALKHFRQGAANGCAECAWGVAGTLGHGYIPDVDGDDAEWYRYCLQAAKGCCGDAMNELGSVANRQSRYLSAFYWFMMAEFYEHPTGGRDAQLVVRKWEDVGKPELEDSIDGVRAADVIGARMGFSVLAEQRKVDDDFLRTSMRQGREGDCEFLQMFLGNMCEFAFEDDEMAKVMYQLAAHNNSPEGMRRLGNMLAYGRGCEQNLESALTWFPAAAEAGERVAQFVMGQFTKQQNPNQAAFWFMASQRRGYEPALQALDELM